MTTPDCCPGVLCEPMSCVAHCWDRLNPIAMGSRILVTGAGIIGNLCCVSAYHLGHRDIILSEPSEGRRVIARKLSECTVLTLYSLQNSYKERSVGIEKGEAS